ncbi:MAG: Holliday junction resolvase RuvX [Candidatus Saccharimonadales bacterium]
MATEPEYIMALDVGTKRIGVALAHRIARLPSPLLTLDRALNTVDDIQKLIDEHNVGAVVVGWPRGLSGQSTGQTQSTEEFAKVLANNLKVPLYLSDEALTSVAAEKDLGEKALTDKAAIDAVAAAYILEYFLRDHPEVMAE